MASKVDISALSMGHEQLVLGEICVESAETPANACANKGLPILFEYSLVIGTPESLFQVQLNIRSGCRRGTAVLMASSSNSDSNFLGSGVLERKCNVVFVLRLDDQPWSHFVIYFVTGRGILVLLILISMCPLKELISGYAGDGGHDDRMSLSGVSCVKVYKLRMILRYIPLTSM